MLTYQYDIHYEHSNPNLSTLLTTEILIVSRYVHENAYFYVEGLQIE